MYSCTTTTTTTTCVVCRQIMRSHSHLLNAFNLLLEHLAKRPLFRPLYTPGPHAGSFDHHPFQLKSVTLKLGKHEAVDLFIDSQDTATPPATAFVTSPPRFRFHHLQKVQTPSTAVRVKAIAHFAYSPLCSYHDPSHSFSYLGFFPHLAVFSYLALWPYFAFFSPSKVA